MQCRCGGQPPLGTVTERRVEQLDPAAAALLGAVHRSVGVAQQGLRSGVVVGDGNADAGLDVQLLGPDRATVCRRASRTRLGECSITRGDDVVADDDELVAAEPGDGVARSDRPTDPFRGNRQQIIAGAMTEGIVDHLELVDVQEHHAELRAAPTARAGQALPEPIVEQDPVRQPGEGVVERLVRERAAPSPCGP